MERALNSRDLYTFTVLADTLLPSVEGDGEAWTIPGGDLGLASRLPDLFDRLPNDVNRRELKLFLGLLNSAAGGLVLYGRPVAFTRLDAGIRAGAFRKMLAHPSGMIRGGAAALKTLITYLWTTTDELSVRPASWDAMGYPGPDGPPPSVPKPIANLEIHTDTDLSCDVVVVGSGAGGGVAAGVLATAGLDVVVLEAGGYHNESDFTHSESDAYRKMYLDGALNSTADNGMTVLAGTGLGGGTIINFTTAFPTPEALREEWDRVGDLGRVFTGEDFEASHREVYDRFEVNSTSQPGSRDRVLEEGLKTLGWHVDALPRNTVDCTEGDCGYCGMGCRIGAKRSVLATYLDDAFRAGARIVTGAAVDRVVVDGSAATGVTARVGEARLQVRARAVVVAAGALHTPAILMRSGLGGPAVGRYLRLHPVTAVWGRFHDRLDPWTGRLQTRYSDQYADLDGSGYGFKFETAPLHPLFPAAFIGWGDGAEFKRDLLGLGHLGVAGILCRDRGHGRVTLRRDGSPVWSYRISGYDRGNLRTGVLRGAEVMAAAGAEEVIASTLTPVRWRPDSEPFDRFVEMVDQEGFGINQTRYFTFHQMGSARMGSDPRTSVVDAENRVHDVVGLYVMDGSCFPTASGVNPMLTISALAHRGATLLARHLQG